ncbi:UDP-xylose and UDP-N-acetylglucosamine transporter-like [Dreissena polymorpha]|nr:UDP-xylose and UDP-N-acetylglucosamine transporter-like [Dreissena polymorpha]
MHPGIAIALVFVGCCSNMVFLELLVSEYPSSGQIVTFTQFLFIACEGFVSTTKFGTVKNKIPMKVYAVMVSMFFVIQVINNMSFRYNIPITLHIIFRAGSLLASLLLGVIILKKSYPLAKYLSVIMITLGICLCTYASATFEHPDEKDKLFDLYSYSMGVALLVFSLVMTARMGLYQESVYQQHGKHPNESLFYNHALPLPGFLLVSHDIYNAVIAFNKSEPMSLMFMSVPKMWVFLAANTITQYICIRSVFTLTAECTALTVTLVVTLRKFISLILSIWYFNNPFTALHWLGTFFVFFGTLLFSDTLKTLYRQSVKYFTPQKENGVPKKTD